MWSKIFAATLASVLVLVGAAMTGYAVTAQEPTAATESPPPISYSNLEPVQGPDASGGQQTGPEGGKRADDTKSAEEGASNGEQPDSAPDTPESASVLEDVLLRASGEEEGGFHETWSWDVAGGEFESFRALATVEFERALTDVLDCVEAVLYDAAGNVVARETAQGPAAEGFAFGGEGGVELVFDFAQADLPEGTVVTGEWSLELHDGQGHSTYDLAVDVLY